MKAVSGGPLKTLGGARGLGWRPTLSIQQRLYLLVLVAVLPALLILTADAVATYRQREHAVRQESLQLAQFAAGELDRIILANRALLTAMANLPAVRAQDAQGCSAYAARLIANYPEFVALLAIDRDGRLFCSSLPPGPLGLPPQDRDLGDRPYFREAKAAGGFIVSTFRRGRISRRPELPLVLPLRDETGQFAGMIVSALDLNWASRYFASRELPPGGSIAVIDRNGTVVLRVPETAEALGLPVRPEFRWLLTATEAGTGEGTGRDGVERLFGYSPLDAPPHGLVVMVGIGKRAAVAQVRAIAIRDAALLAAACVLALLATGVGGRRFVQRPLHQLAQTAERWAGGDLSARAGLADRSSEIGRLAVAFDRMAETIAVRNRELTTTVAELDAALHEKVLLAAELAHRVKNTLATVMAMAQVTLRDSESLPRMVPVFRQRLLALSHAHDLLTQASWQAADVRQIVASIAAPHVDSGCGRITLHGPEVRLPPAQAIGLAMAVHELCTNALKYGALSTEAGRIDMDWSVPPGDRLHFRWRESGGPPVVPPTRRGFGTRFIEASFRTRATGHVTLEFAPGGVVCVIELPIEATGREAPVARDP